MAKRDDDFGDLDDFDDFDDFDMEGEDPSADRSPSSSFRRSFVDEFISRDGIREGIKRTTYKSLPDGYKDAYDALSSTKSDLETIYDKTARELAPTKNALKKVGRAFGPLMDKVLPKRMAERYQELTAKEESGYGRQNGEDMAVAAVMSEVFGAQQEAEKNRREEDEVDKEAQRKVETERHRATENARIQSEQINLKFQMRMLEVQYRHLFVAREHFSVQKASSVDQINLLKEIKKNTGLPNEAKIQADEHFRRLATEKLFGIATETTGRRIATMRGRMLKNLEREASSLAQLSNELFTGISETIQEGEGGDGTPSNAEMFGSMGGSLARDWVADRFGDAIKEQFNKNKFVRRSASWLAAQKANLPRKVNELAYKEQGFIGKTARFLLGGSAIGESREAVNHNLAEIAGMPVAFDGITRRTIIEIIPHYQSLQLQVLERIAGNADAKRQIFSVSKERMVDFDEEVSDIRKKAVSALGGSSINEAIALVNEIDTNKRLSEEAKIALATAITKDSLGGMKAFNPVRYIAGNNFGKHSDKIGKVLKEYYNISKKEDRKPGELDNLKKILVGEDNEFKSAIGSDEESNLRMERSIMRYGRVANYAGDLDKILHLASGTGRKDVLRAAGLITQGQYGDNDVVNSDYKWKIIENAIRAGVLGKDVDLDNLIYNDEDVGEKTRMAMKVKSTKQRRQNGGRPSARRTASSRDWQDTVPNVNLSTAALEELVKAGNTTNEDLLTRIVKHLDDGLTVKGVSGADSDTMGRLDRLIEALTLNVTNNSFGSTLGRLARGTGRFGLRALKASTGFAGRLASGGLSTTGSLLRGARDVAAGSWRKLSENYDIYLKGAAEPVIRAVLVRDGAYCDENGVVITTYRELLKALPKGIYSVEADGSRGALLVSPEDVKNGLIHAATKAGQGVLGRLVNFGLDMFSRSSSLAATTMSVGRSLIGGAKDIVVGKLTEPVDVYLGTEPEPRLRKILFINGGYYSKTTGKPLKHPGEIDGDVQDADGNVLLSAKDISQFGIHDRWGNPIESGTISAAIGRLIGRGVGLGVRALKWGWNRAKDAAGIAGSIIKGGASALRDKFMGSGSFRSEEYLKEILHHMRTVWPITADQNKARDKIREPGSAILDQADNESEEATQRGLLTEIADGIASGGGGEGDDTGGSWRDRLGGLKDRAKDWGGRAKSGAKDRFSNWRKKRADKKLEKQQRKLPGKKGLLRRGAGALWKWGIKPGGRLAWAVAGGLTAVGLWAAGGIATAAAWGASGALALLSNPVGWAIAGGAAATYLGWEAYKAIQRRKPRLPIETMRMLQYGIDVTKDDQVIAIRYLEEKIVDKISVTVEGKVKYNFTFSEAWTFACDAFGNDTDDDATAESFKTWFYKRFLVVLPMHMITAKILSVPVRQVDEKLNNFKKEKYVNNCRLDDAKLVIGHDPYDVTASPFSKFPISDNRHLVKDVVNRIIAASQKGEETDEKTGSLGAIGRFFDNLFGRTTSTKNNYAQAVADRKLEIIKQQKDKNKEEYWKRIADAERRSREGAPKKPGKINTVRPASRDKDAIPYPARKAVTGANTLITPVAGTITSAAGSRSDPFSMARSDHKGVDYAAPIGTPVYAAAAGIVTRAEFSNSYGNVLYIDHNDGRQTRYAHLDRFAAGITMGAYVEQGDLIGYVGNTGKSTGPHLHFEYRDVLDTTGTKLTGWAAQNLRNPLNPQAFTGETKAVAKPGAPNPNNAAKEEASYAAIEAKTAPKLAGISSTPPVSSVPTAVADPAKVREEMVSGSRTTLVPEVPTFNVSADVSGLGEPIVSTARNAEQQRLEQLTQMQRTNQLLEKILEGNATSKVAAVDPAKPTAKQTRVTTEPFSPVVNNNKRGYS